VTVPTVNPVTGEKDLPQAGEVISGFRDLNPNVASLPSDNHVRFSSNYGDQSETWQGFDVSLILRMAGRGQISGGLSTGKTITDNCEVLAKVPEAATAGVSLTGAPSNIAGPNAVPFCRQETPWITQIKGLATYTIPGVDVQLAGTFQMVPGIQESATLIVPCGAGTDVAAQLGRACTATGGNVTVNVLHPGTFYGPKLYQTDLRVGKIIRFPGNRRATASVDLFNAFNANNVQQDTAAYPTTAKSAHWRVPQRIEQGRLLKFTLAMNF
jgi:hypothetical protein